MNNKNNSKLLMNKKGEKKRSECNFVLLASVTKSITNWKDYNYLQPDSFLLLKLSSTTTTTPLSCTVQVIQTVLILTHINFEYCLMFSSSSSQETSASNTKAPALFALLSSLSTFLLSLYIGHKMACKSGVLKADSSLEYGRTPCIVLVRFDI